MRFQVPQFIEVEDKIFGPLTLKQFLYLAGGGAAIFLLKQILPFFIWIIVAALIAAFVAALAFVKINNRPFAIFLSHALGYYVGKRLYVWRKEEKKPIRREVLPIETPPGALPYQEGTPKLTEKHLQDLAWSLDIKEKIKR
jgi:hypothetical protein